MMRFAFKSLVIVTLLACAGPAFGQVYSFDFVGAGVRAKGMGNAHIAIANDVNGISWNPAGLNDLESPIVSFSRYSTLPRGTFEFRPIQLGPGIENLSGRIKNSGSVSGVTDFNLVAPIRIKGHHFVGSIAVNRVYDDYLGSRLRAAVKEPVMFVFEGVTVLNDTLYADYDEISTSYGNLKAVNIGFGTRLYGNLTFGLAINNYTGNSVTETSITTLIDEYPSLRSSFVVQYAAYDFNGLIIDSSSFSGVNFTIGFKLNGERLDAGLVIRTPFSLNRETDQSNIRTLKLNDVVETDGTYTTYETDMLTKFDMPLMVSLGLGYQATENLLLAVDFDYRGFAGGMLSFRTSRTLNPGGSDIEKFEDFDPDWRNVLAVRMGAEYMKDGSLGTIPLRAGFGITPSAWRFISGGTQYQATAGTGIHWEQIHLDLSYSYSLLSFDADQRIDEDNYLLLDYDSRDHRFGLQFTGYF